MDRGRKSIRVTQSLFFENSPFNLTIVERSLFGGPVSTLRLVVIEVGVGVAVDALCGPVNEAEAIGS